MNEAKKYWFPAKRYGWGWGFPVAWQGKVVLVFFFVFAAVGAFTLLPLYGDLAFVIYCGFLCITLVAICRAKGEPPRWRWGSK